MDCLGLSLVWESSQELRTRMREHKKLVMYPETERYCKATRINAVTNKHVLIPVLKRIGATSGQRLPHLDDLIPEVTALFNKCGLSTGEKAPYKTTVEIKQLAGFVKRRAARREVLTRKAQLQLKEEKQQKKKQEQEEKKAEKERAKAEKEEAKAEKQREKAEKASHKGQGKGRGRGQKQEASAAKDDSGEKAADNAEVEDKKPRRRLKKLEESGVNEVPPAESAPEDSELKAAATKGKPKAKATAKGSAKSKAKAKAKSKVKASPKKAGAKRKAKKAETCSGKAADDEEESMETPKKTLFQSDDDADEELTPMQDGGHERFNSKSGKVEPLAEIFEKDKVESHLASKRQRTKAAVEAGDEEDAPKSKRQKNGVKKVNLSPFAKKEAARRKKKEDSTMKEPAREDLAIQGVFMQHMRNVEKIAEEADVKKYLIEHLKDKELNKTFRLNEYWKRPAVGVKAAPLAEDTSVVPEVAYFGRVGTLKGSWKFHITLVYAAASLTVPCPDLLHACYLGCLSKNMVYSHDLPQS
eukprot:Skav200711  [mRNA]  locus=scaffold2650:68428:71830:+ [translate_table: standard]